MEATSGQRPRPAPPRESARALDAARRRKEKHCLSHLTHWLRGACGRHPTATTSHERRVPHSTMPVRGIYSAVPLSRHTFLLTGEMQPVVSEAPAPTPMTSRGKEEMKVDEMSVGVPRVVRRGGRIIFTSDFPSEMKESEMEEKAPREVGDSSSPLTLNSELDRVVRQVDMKLRPSFVRRGSEELYGHAMYSACG